MSRGLRIAGILVAGVLLSGAIWLAIGILERWLFRGELPQGPWWRFVAAIPIMGAVALVFEGIGEAVGHAFGINKSGTPKWKEYLGVFTILAVVFGLIVLFNTMTK